MRTDISLDKRNVEGVEPEMSRALHELKKRKGKCEVGFDLERCREKR